MKKNKFTGLILLILAIAVTSCGKKEAEKGQAAESQLPKVKIATVNERDVEQVQTLASQIFISLITIILNIVVSFGVVIYKSKIVFLFFVCTIPVAVLIIVGFKGKIKSHNREFREEMEETSAKVMEMVEIHLRRKMMMMKRGIRNEVKRIFG